MFLSRVDYLFTNDRYLLGSVGVSGIVQSEDALDED